MSESKPNFMNVETFEVDGTVFQMADIDPERFGLTETSRKLRSTTMPVLCVVTGDKLDPLNGIKFLLSKRGKFPNCYANKAAVDQLGREQAIARVVENFRIAKLFGEK